ncbi:MAG: LptF/LptG family permease [Bacteroidales bacterium]|nr:LptF/LptG family permease [Bacteroidales bacterium]
MKKIDRLILRSFLGPLLLTFAIAVFVLLMQFVWKYVDDMVGKGLEFKVIAELLFYASATFVPMALPIAVLFASIMTMGNFGEKYELVAMKAGGISLTRAMMPMALVVLLLTGVAFYFANNVMPAATLKYRTILYDVTRKKPAINIKPGEFYNEIDGYVIHINKKHTDGMTLEDVTIYDHSQGPTNVNIVKARTGIMQTSADERYMVLTLNDGCLYNEETTGEKQLTRPFTRIFFDQQIMAFDISSFAFNKSDESFFEGNYRMMNTTQLQEHIVALEASRNQRLADYQHNLDEHLRAQHMTPPTTETVATDSLLWHVDGTSFAQLKERGRRQVLSRAQNEARQCRELISMHQQILSSDNEYINRHYIEYHRKFTLSIACLILFLVGAPFGSIVRRGGLGLPLVASVAFFVSYYVIGMIAEKAVRGSVMGPIGMWISSFVMLPIGLYLTIQATTDRNQIISEWIIKIRERIQRRRAAKHPTPPSVPKEQ